MDWMIEEGVFRKGQCHFQGVPKQKRPWREGRVFGSTNNEEGDRDGKEDAK
jgi:hypothetical protein